MMHVGWLPSKKFAWPKGVLENPWPKVKWTENQQIVNMIIKWLTQYSFYTQNDAQWLAA